MQRTHVRQPVTLHIGPFEAHETMLSCPECRPLRVFHSEELASLVAPGCTFGYDVMVFAGESLLRQGCTVAETVAELASHHVVLSESEVRRLAARFVVRLGIAHAEASEALRRHLQLSGGYVLHIDSTTAGDGPHLLTGIDEISGFVLLNVKIRSENAAEVATFLRELQARFGTPAALSCDMARGLLAALAEVFEDVPIFICHFHFLRDVGKDLLEAPYRIVRERLRYHGPKAKLERLREEVREALRDHAAVLHELLGTLANGSDMPPTARALPYEALLGALLTTLLEAEHRGDGCGFPFDRPKVDVFRQAQQTLLDAYRIARDAKLPPAQRQLHQRLIDILRPLCADTELAEAAAAVELNCVIFDRLREAMRIAEPGTGKGLNDQGAAVPMATIEANVNAFCEWVQASEVRLHLPGVKAMLAQISSYREQLFADPIRVDTPSGPRQIQPQRTNNILEQFFRSLLRKVCKRTGERAGPAFMRHLLPDTPLLANLDNPDYLELLLDGSADLSERLSRIDGQEVERIICELAKPPEGLRPGIRRQLRTNPITANIVAEILRQAS